MIVLYTQLDTRRQLTELAGLFLSPTTVVYCGNGEFAVQRFEEINGSAYTFPSKVRILADAEARVVTIMVMEVVDDEQGEAAAESGAAVVP